MGFEGCLAILDIIQVVNYDFKWFIALSILTFKFIVKQRNGKVYLMKVINI